MCGSKWRQARAAMRGKREQRGKRERTQNQGVHRDPRWKEQKKMGKSIPIPCHPRRAPRRRHDSKGRLGPSAWVSKCKGLQDGEDANKESKSADRVSQVSFPNRCWRATQVRQGRPAQKTGVGQSYYSVRRWKCKGVVAITGVPALLRAVIG